MREQAISSLTLKAAHHNHRTPVCHFWEPALCPFVPSLCPLSFPLFSSPPLPPPFLLSRSVMVYLHCPLGLESPGRRTSGHDCEEVDGEVHREKGGRTHTIICRSRQLEWTVGTSSLGAPSPQEIPGLPHVIEQVGVQRWHQRPLCLPHCLRTNYLRHYRRWTLTSLSLGC